MFHCTNYVLFNHRFVYTSFKLYLLGKINLNRASWDFTKCLLSSTMNIDQYRAAIGLFHLYILSKNARQVRKFINFISFCNSYFNVSFFVLFYMCLCLHVTSVPFCIIQILLLRAGIHPNPGPVINGLSICQYNVQSLYMRSVSDDKCFKIHDIYTILCLENNFDIICLTETWLTEDILSENISIDGYSLIRRDSGKKRGGVAVYYNNRITCCNMLQLYPKESEIMWLSFNIKNIIVLVCVCYRPPNQSVGQIDLFMNELQTSFDSAKCVKHDYVLICGDFNDPCTCWNSKHDKSELKQRLYDWANLNNIVQLVNEPTFYTSHSTNILDLIFTYRNVKNENGVLPPIDRTAKYSHCPVYCKLDLPIESDCAYTRHIWRYNEGDYVALNLGFYHMNWVNIFRNTTSIDNAATCITNIIMDTSRKHIPNKYVTIRPRDKPWMSGEIRLLLRKRDRAFRKYKHCLTEYYRAKWHNERKKVNHAIQLAKRTYSAKLTSILSNPSCPSKDFWRYTKSFMGIRAESNIPTIIDHGVSYVSSLSKAQLFAEYFASQSSLDNFEIPNLPVIQNNAPYTINNIYVSEVEIYGILKRLNTKKATGPDQVSNRILKECALSLSFPLQQLFNLSFSTGYFPSCWKMSNTSPIYKASDKYLKTNYRPISLL